MLDPVTGFRLYLDPRKADTDGDGLPDGYEIAMCTSSNEEVESKQVEGAWVCGKFDPLNASDGAADYDKDGFDVNQDGELDEGEYFSNLEEYSYGMPDGWVTEIDGLWHADNYPEAAVLNSVTWLGTDPLNNDSDFYRWGLLDVRPTSIPILGDSIPDGWEAYFDMDPLNQSDDIADDDNDGWDMNGDGTISKSHVASRIDKDEAFSNLEEYQVFLDDGNWVQGGLKITKVSRDETEDVDIYDQGHPWSPIAHYDVKRIITVDHSQSVAVAARTGVTFVHYDEQNVLRSNVVEIATGVRILDMELWSPSSEVNQNFVILGTTQGVRVHQLQDLGDGLASMARQPLQTLGDGNFTSVARLGSSDSSTAPFLAVNDQGVPLSFTIQWGDSPSVSLGSAPSGLEAAIAEHPGVINDIVYVGSIPPEHPDEKLYLGSDAGLLTYNLVTDVSDWVYHAQRSENFTVHDEISVAAGVATRMIVPVGPPGSDEVTKLWLATASGIHGYTLSTQRLEVPYTMLGDDQVRANDLYSITPVPEESKLLVGSTWGLWALTYNEPNVGARALQTKIPGQIVDSVTIPDSNGELQILAAGDPGRFANIVLMDPKNNDSDFDGLPDGWEYNFGLDPSDPYDGILDSDGDGLDLDGDGFIDRNWTNRDEFEYRPVTPEGNDTTDPRSIDTDGDGLPDGVEYYGRFLMETNFTCAYRENGDYVCDEGEGSVAMEEYRYGNVSDLRTDPTNDDSDGDGMSDGWEILHRRWIGQRFTGANRWTLDPNNPDDAWEDADGDGLPNLCEYNWTRDLELLRQGDLPQMIGEYSDASSTWVEMDPNSKDSDGDTLTDGWEARYSPGSKDCSWSNTQKGVNPLDGSDWNSNPDGDWYDANRDGVAQPEENLTNFHEYHLKDTLFYNSSAIGDTPNLTGSGDLIPEGFSTVLFNENWFESALTRPFGNTADDTLAAQQVAMAIGSLNPLSADTDGDEMPDGWEVYHARWDSFYGEWTLNPSNNSDRTGDADKDGMINWAEYNVVGDTWGELDHGRSVPTYGVKFGEGVAAEVTDATKLLITGQVQPPFGDAAFLHSDQYNATGPTADPNNVDTDGDGVLDGIELLFTNWSIEHQRWTLNPLDNASRLDSLDGKLDSDNDGLRDVDELSVSDNPPDNGGTYLFAPTFFEDAVLVTNNVTIRLDAVSAYLAGLGTTDLARAAPAASLLQEWIDAGSVGNPLFMSTMFSILFPDKADTDDDGMSDGYEYYYTKFDSTQARGYSDVRPSYWTLNPFLDDGNLDADGDSYDCNGDGIQSADENFTNSREYKGHLIGKFGDFEQPWHTDAIAAIQWYDDGVSTADEAIAVMMAGHLAKDPENLVSRRVDLINLNDPTSFQTYFLGSADSTRDDSDGDGLPDGWEYCYARYGDPWTVFPQEYAKSGGAPIYHWTSSPVNPIDVNFDGDHDGWYSRGSGKLAPQGEWNSFTFTLDGSITYADGEDIPFTNMMEYLNGTRPDLNDSDGDCVGMHAILDQSGAVVDHRRNYSLMDGLEVLKFGTNPVNDDTDGDFLPDWYEHRKGWNETNQNWTSLRLVEMQWEQEDFTGVNLPLHWDDDAGIETRPLLAEKTVEFNATNPNDATKDYDKDGKWKDTDEDGVADYIPYNNFHEFFAITSFEGTNNNYSNADDVRGVTGQESWTWKDLRADLLGASWWMDPSANYLDIVRDDASDPLYAWTINEENVDYAAVRSEPSESETQVYGNHTSPYLKKTGEEEDRPNVVRMVQWSVFVDGGLLGGDGVLDTEFPKKWYLLDIDWDFTADGTDPFNYDTDGDWYLDSMEVAFDQEAANADINVGRGETYSPLRCDYQACRSM